MERLVCHGGAATDALATLPILPRCTLVRKRLRLLAGAADPTPPDGTVISTRFAPWSSRPISPHRPLRPAMALGRSPGNVATYCLGISVGAGVGIDAQSGRITRQGMPAAEPLLTVSRSRARLWRASRLSDRLSKGASLFAAALSDRICPFSWVPSAGSARLSPCRSRFL